MFERDHSLVSISRSDFLQNIDTLAGWFLRNRIVNKNIAIIGNNSFEWLVICFAAMSSGNTVVPIDYSVHSDTLIEMLRDTDVTVIFHDKSSLFLDNQSGIVAYPFSLVWGILENTKKGNESETVTLLDCAPEQLAALFFTSGTEGKKKAAILTHKNIYCSVLACCETWDFRPEGIAFSVMPFFHVFGLFAGFMMFLYYDCGIYLCTNRKYFFKDLRKYEPQAIMLVPLYVEALSAQIEMLSQTCPQTGMPNQTVNEVELSVAARTILGNNLKYIVVSGAGLNKKYQTIFAKIGVTVIVAYGSTETTSGVSINRREKMKIGSVGLPMRNCAVKIAGDGEILVRGDNVFSGYYKMREESALALMDGWYHTGDLGYMDDEGFLFLTGRKHNMLTLSNGENVSAEYLEDLVARIPGVVETQVRIEGGTLIAEIFSRQPEYDLTYFQKAVSDVNQQLPNAQRIRRIVIRSSRFPRNAIGKKLRRST